MGSTNFNAPPRKLTLIAIAAVVGLHVLTALALVAMKPTTPVDKVMTPIEIQMVTLPVAVAEPEIEEPRIEEVAIIEKPTSISEPKVPEPKVPEPQPQPAAAAKSLVEKPSKPVEIPKPSIKEPVQPTPKKTTPEPKTQPDIPKVVESEPFQHYVEAQELVSTAQADASAVINDRKVVAEQAEKAAREAHTRATQQAHAKMVKDAQAAANAAREIQATADAKVAQKAEADREAQAVKDTQAAAEKSARDAQAKADARAEKEAAARIKADAEAKAAVAASNTPVNFNASNANWAAAPNFSFPERAKRGARSGDTFNLVLLLRVNKQGGIDSVSLAKSSGNAILDREAQRQVRSGKFRPFQQNGVPVVGNVTLPISYAMP